MLSSYLERFISWRYLRSPRKEGFIAVVALFSFFGILLGVATLIIVTSVMNGFRHELMGRILGMNGHLTVYAPLLQENTPIQEEISRLPTVQSMNPLIEKQGLFISATHSAGGIVHAMHQQDLIKRKLINNGQFQGSLSSFDEKAASLVLGCKLAAKLGVGVGDRVKMMSAETKATAFGFIPKTKTFQVVGIFDSGMYEYDSAFAFISLREAQSFFNMENCITGFEIFLDNPEEAPSVGKEILQLPSFSQAFSQALKVYDWQRANNHLFSAIEVERNVMFLILTLIVLVAVFNIVSCLVMMVKDKTRDIAILRTMGATKGMILKLFFMTGGFIGFCGTVGGALLGLSFSYHIDAIKQFLEHMTGLELFRAEIYFLSHLPSRVDLKEVFFILGMSLLFSLLATLYPAWKASRLNPVEGLRYE